MSKILFLATEDWFVRSHFLPLLRRARDDGFEVVVAARESGALRDEAGVRLIPMPFERGSVRALGVIRQVAHLHALLKRERPDIVHAIALLPIALLILSGYRGARVLALTGRGYLGIAPRLGARAMSWGVRRMLRAALRRRDTLLLVENDADRQWIGAAATRTMTMPGAGVDPQLYQAAPEPPSPPVIVGVVARLVRSKGVDLAVAAVTQLRAAGHAVTLRIAGAADRDNPDHVDDSEIAAWRARDGIEVAGAVADVNAFWARVHIACLPSRGGEGLPRALLEAAACGRPIVTSDAPGCADFAVAAVGLTAPRGDGARLAEAVLALAQNPDLRLRMGKAARARVIEGYTERHAADCAAAAWRRVLAAGGAR